LHIKLSVFLNITNPSTGSHGVHYILLRKLLSKIDIPSKLSVMYVSTVSSRLETCRKSLTRLIFKKGATHFPSLWLHIARQCCTRSDSIRLYCQNSVGLLVIGVILNSQLSTKEHVNRLHRRNDHSSNVNCVSSAGHQWLKPTHSWRKLDLHNAQYLTDDLHQVAIESRRRLRSASTAALLVPATARSTIGDRAFSRCRSVGRGTAFRSRWRHQRPSRFPKASLDSFIYSLLPVIATLFYVL